MPEPLVSVIIVHWNEADLLRNCLQSLEKSDYPNIELIVSDNGSTDGAVEMVRTEFPNVHLIENKENLGFARGNNIGIRASKGKYVIMLNADTTVEPNWVGVQVAAMEADSRIGLCQGKMMLMREPGRINSVGMVLTREGLVTHVGDGETDTGQFGTQRPIFAVSGACACCRREALDQIGLFDEDFFAYYEDCDLSWRAWIRGWKCMYVPGAVVHHYRNATVNKNPSLYWHLRYLNQRNRIWTLLKNFSWGSLIRLSPPLARYELVMMGKGFKAWLTQSREPAELKARWDALRGLGKMLAKRRVLQRARFTAETEIRKLAFPARSTGVMEEWSNGVMTENHPADPESPSRSVAQDPITPLPHHSSSPLRIAMVVPQFPCFGETFILSQITGLIDLGVEVDVIATNPSGESTIHEDVVGYKLLERTKYLHLNEQYGRTLLARLRNGCRAFAQNFSRSPRSTLATLNAFRYGKQALRLAYLFRLKPFLETRYEIVHCHFGPNAKSFLFLKDIQNVKLVATFHGYDFSRVIREQGAAFYRDLFERADLITINSQYGKGRLLAAGAEENRIVQLRMSVPTERFPFQERTLRPGEPVRILTVARLFEKKGYEFSVPAIAKVARLFPNLEYWIVGDPNGPSAPRIREMIRELKMEDRIKILGTKTQAELIEIYQQCHLFVLASVTARDGDEEGQGLVLQEAQACGMPVVATRHNGFPESLIEGETGFLVPERDADALAERILFLLRNPQTWSSMGKAGRSFVQQHFDAKMLSQQLLDLYCSLVKGCAGPHCSDLGFSRSVGSIQPGAR